MIRLQRRWRSLRWKVRHEVETLDHRSCIGELVFGVILASIFLAAAFDVGWLLIVAVGMGAIVGVGFLAENDDTDWR